MENKTGWSDGKSAMVCALLGLLTIPASLLVGQIGGVMFILSGILFLFCMAFFWSALWRTRGRDVWAWIALFIDVIAMLGSCALTMNLGD